jgi:putative DNA primase/helicase
MKGESPEEFLARAGIREAPPPDGHEGNVGKGKKGVSPAEPKACSQTNMAAEDHQAIAMLGEGDVAPFVDRAKTDQGFPFEPEAIAALNRLTAADFERLRARLKADGQVRLPALEAAMKAAASGTARGDGLPGRPITFHEIKPWPEPVDGAALLTEIAETIGKYVIMDPHQRDAAALGAVFAHTHDLRDTAPIFFIVSPTKRCGKTRLERVIKRLVPKPLMASSATPAFLARAIEKHRPTALIDEYDATAAGDQAMAETLRGQLNSSFDRDGAKVGKCVPLPGGGYDEREFSTWAPTWIAGIKKIPETVEDRSVVLRLKRKLPSEKVARFRAKDGGELDILRRKIARFVVDNEQRLRDIEPDMPEALSAAGDRAPDAWEPLAAIADVAGAAWPKRAPNAALALTGVDAAPLDGDVDAALLSDINHILNACDAFGPAAEQLKNNKQIAVESLEAFRRGEDGGKHRSRRIVGLGGEQLTNALATFVESKWPAWDNGKPMRPHQLARLLGAYGLRSQPLRDGEMVFRGYPRDGLEDAIERYITCTPFISGDFARYSVTRPGKPGEIELYENVTGEARNASENAGNADKPGGCDVVTPKKPGDEGGEVEQAANPLSGFIDEQRRPCRLKLFAAASEVVPGPEFDPPSRLTRTIL